MAKKTRKKKSSPKEEPLQSFPLYAAATGSDNAVMQTQLIHQIRSTIWNFKEASEQDGIDKLAAAVGTLVGIKPVDELEGMLAVQMVATHNAAIECLRRAMIPDQTFEGRNQNLNHASKLLSIYTRQIETLNKHRGKGQQKVTVEYVNVEAGGQAIVGHVEANDRTNKKGKTNRDALKTISHNPAETVDFKPAKSTAKTKRKS